MPDYSLSLSEWQQESLLPVAFSIEKKFSLVYTMLMDYKVVETSTVTDEEVEKILNEWTAKGYVFESIQFVTAVSSKRPTMAFLFFTKKA
jgi:hypothetical protein